MRYLMSVLIAAGCVALSPLASAEALSFKSLKKLSWSPDHAVWELDRDGLSDKGTPEASIFHKNAGIMASLQENPAGAGMDAYWQDYVKSTKAVSRVFNEVGVPGELKPPAGFSCKAEESSLGDDPPGKTRVLCGAAEGGTLALLSLTLPKEEWRPHAAAINDLLKGVGWRK